MRYLLILFLILTSSIIYGQSKPCNTEELYKYLLAKGLVNKHDKDLIRCSPLATEVNGNGVYSFGSEETDSFTFFFILKGTQILFIDNSNLDNILGEVSAYFKVANIPLEKKIACYESIIDITKAETVNNHWSLPIKN